MDVTPRTGRRKRLVALGGAGIVVCICAGVASRYTTHPFNGIDVEDLDADLRASLSTGSTMDEGHAWFAQQGITPTEYNRGNISFSLFASVPNNSLLETAEIHILLNYRWDRRLTSVHVSRQARSR